MDIIMIEIVNDKERNLKNLKQIGTPRENNKIYIENFAYAKIKENSYRDKRVFVLMGHTERMEGRYATFIEAAIPVGEMEFAGNIPRWDNRIWGEIFREIKRLYEDMIIVGWALDVKGMNPKVSPDLERVHREHFGGVHQLLFLLDTLESEEVFYIYKENKLVSKDGFYIYHRARQKEVPEAELPTASKEYVPIISKPQIDIELDIPEGEVRKGGRYRQLIQEQETLPEKTSDGGNLGLAIAVAMLLFVIGVGAYENRDGFLGEHKTIETNLLQEESTETQVPDAVETNGTEVGTESQETSVEIIPVEVISGEEQED